MDAEPDKANATNELLDLSLFVRGLTHEVANPLNAVAMNCELLRIVLARGEPERVRETMDRLVTASARCSGLIRSLQKFGSALRREPSGPVAVAELIDGAMQALSLEYSETMPAFDVRPLDAMLDVDRAAVERALAALLRNSAEGGSNRVEIAALRDAGDILIDVRDDGCGFLPEDAGKYEKPFYSTHRQPSNMGLGLTLAREVLRANGGSLQIVPCERGAHLRVRLPETPDASEA